MDQALTGKPIISFFSDGSGMASEPIYCTVEDVAHTLDVPSPLDPTGTLMFTPTSHPTDQQV